MKLVLMTIIASFSLNGFGASSDIPERREYPVNEKINPCTDLYEHACSKVIESFKLREDRRKHTFAFNDSSERILEFKKNTINEIVKSDSKDPITQELKNYFLSCVNEDARAKEEKEYVAGKLAMLEKIQNKKDWLSSHVSRLRSGDPGFFSYWSLDNFDDPRKSDLVLSTGYSFLPEKSYAKNPELLKEFEKIVTDFFKSIGSVNPEEKAKTIVKYEEDVQENRLFPVEMRIAYSLRRFVPRKDLLINYSDLQLAPFLKQVPDKSKIRILNPKTLPFLSRIAKNYSLDELKTIQTFYELSPRLDKSNPAYFNEMFAFKNKFLGGKNKRSELKEECTENTMYTFGPEFDYVVLPKMFPNFSSAKIAELVGMIKQSIQSSLATNTWLTPAAKKEALRKISKAYMRLVAPKSFDDWKFLKAVEYNPEKYLANHDKRDDLVEEREFKYFRELKDIRSWEGVRPLEVNAFYEPSYNQFTMLQGILQYPFYDQNGPLVENLAGVGMVVGHELGHGIDDQGSKYDADGKLRDWMSAKDLKKFKELTASLVDQYSKAGMNGELTLGENIGDMVGLTAAYDAAFKGRKISPEELQKEERQFFLSYARSWCEVQLPGVKELRLKSDPHSLGFARVNEVVKHFVGFKDAFSCKETDAMVLPADKRVHIW
jgi:putative endopeptidase